MKYSLVVLCVSCLFVQIYANTVRIQGIDEVKKAFEAMMKVIKSDLTTAESSLDNAMDTVNLEATNVTNNAKNEISVTMGYLQIMMDIYIQEAAALGVNTTDCQTYVDQFAATPNNTLKEIASCMATQVTKAKSHCDNALANCKKIESDLANMESEIDNCDGNAECYDKLLKEIVEAKKTGPQHIAEEVNKATFLVSLLVPSLKICEIDPLNKVGNSAGHLMAEFVVCAGL